MAESSELLCKWVLDSTERDEGELPVFPVVASRLVDLLEQPGAALADIEELICQDQTIAARVIGAANSVRFAGAMPAEDLSQAIMRLGFGETADLVMAAACRALFDMEDRAHYEVFEEFWGAIWQDSLICAYGARLIAEELKLPDAQQVFLGALLRDVGILLVLKMIARGVVAGELERPGEAELSEVVNTVHVALGANYLRSSNLPEFVVAAAAHHHDLELALSPETSRPLHVVRLADGLCSAIGLGTFCFYDPRPLIEEDAGLLRVSAEQLEVLELHLCDLTEQLRSLL